MNYIIRPWQKSDIKSLCKYANNKHIADNLREEFPYPYTKEDAEYFITLAEKFPEEKGFIYAVELNHEAIGSISFQIGENVFCKSAEVGYWLAEEYWRNGIMTGVVTSVISLAFKNYEIERVYAEVMEDNIGSRNVLERAGMELEAIHKKSIYKNGKLHNSCIYAKIKED